jgi:hypothetical protein
LFRNPLFVCALLSFATAGPSAHALFDLTLTIPTPSSFTPTQLANLQTAMAQAETLWESKITGYQPGISITGMTISFIEGSALGDTFPPSTVSQGGFELATSTTIRIAASAIDNYFAWNAAGFPPPDPAYLGQNYLDDIVAHEIGHALGIGTLWLENDLYTNGTGMYLGTHGVQAYRAEFDPTATFVPVELAGNPGTIDQHWNQLMRSSSQEGNPANPFILSPLTGITDAQGRDFAMDLLSGALDPDFGQPFLSYTTLQSLRDLGFTVVPEPTSVVLILFASLTFGCRRRL